MDIQTQDGILLRGIPDGTPDDIIKARIAKIRSSRSADAPVDPTAEMSAFERGRAGAGKAFYDLGRGAGNLLTDAFPGLAEYGLPTRKDTDEAKARDKALMNTTGGVVGNVLGNVALAAPTALIPGAGTVTGGAAVGAGMGLLQPVGEEDSRLKNTAISAAAGAAIPALVKTAQVGKAALVDPFTEAGRTRIVGGALNRAVDDPQAIAAALRNARGATPGFEPTAAQAVPENGLAAMERTARAIDPAGFSSIDQSQRAALVNALRSVAKTPEERAAAEAAREAASAPLYAQATKASVPGDAALEALLQRPSMKAAAEEAANLARERGGSFQLRAGSAPQPSAILDEAGRPFMTEAVPSQVSGRALHDMKMGLDTAIKDPARGFLGAKRNAALGTKDEFLGWVEKNIPEYGAARQAYAQGSKPINQMDIGQELYNRFVPALADTSVPFKSRADALAQALRNGDSLAQNVTGMKGATLAGTMEPEQIALLNGVVKDAGMKAAAETAGRGVGSDTVQKMAMSNVIAEAGLPSWISSVGRIPGGWLKTAGEMVYTKNDDTLRRLMADVLKDPQKAAAAMEKAGVAPSKIAEVLRVGAQSGALGLPAAMEGK